MNHDYTHCYDYNPDVCPKDCYRAQLVEDLLKTNYRWPVSWSMLKNTVYCPKWPKEEKDE